MFEYKNLRIVGTSHVAVESVRTIEHEINSFEPEIVCLELDKNRFVAIQQKTKGKVPGIRDIRQIGFKGYLFLLFGSYVEHKLGSKVGLKPGAEMLAAIKLSKKKKIMMALVDQDIRITLRRFSDTFTWKEKWNLFKDLVRGLFFRKKELKRMGLEGLDLNKVPVQEVIDKIMVQVKVKYPNFYKVLVDDRNKIMARRISALMLKYPEKKILAVVGAGHGKDMLELIKKIVSNS